MCLHHRWLIEEHFLVPASPPSRETPQLSGISRCWSCINCVRLHLSQSLGPMEASSKFGNTPGCARGHPCVTRQVAL